MKKRVPIIIVSVLLVVSLVGNVVQYCTYQKQATEMNTNISTIQTQLETAVNEVSQAKTLLEEMKQQIDSLNQEKEQLLAERDKALAELEAITASTSQPQKNDVQTNKSETTNSGSTGWLPPMVRSGGAVSIDDPNAQPIPEGWGDLVSGDGGTDVNDWPALWGDGGGYLGDGDGGTDVDDYEGLWP